MGKDASVGVATGVGVSVGWGVGVAVGVGVLVFVGEGVDVGVGVGVAVEVGVGVGVAVKVGVGKGVGVANKPCIALQLHTDQANDAINRMLVDCRNCCAFIFLLPFAGPTMGFTCRRFERGIPPTNYHLDRSFEIVPSLGGQVQ